LRQTGGPSAGETFQHLEQTRHPLQMARTGAGTMNSPISIDDSEEEVVQELTHSQFYQGSSTQGADDLNDVARQPSQRASYLSQIISFIL